MTPAQKIIQKFGGQTALAEALGKPQSTVQYWRASGSIPARWHRQILNSGLKRGLDISPGELVEATAQLPGPTEFPVAKWPGELEVADLEIPVYVLDDGRRVLSRTGALNFLTGGKGGGNLESYLDADESLPSISG